MSSTGIYCVYLTTYLGNKLPMFYIGSTSVKKVESGYHGSVNSKQYKKIWFDEIKNNPKLFKTRIIQRFTTRKEAIEKENKLQVSLNVIHSRMYVNKNIASVNSPFSHLAPKGKDHPHYNKTIFCEYCKRDIKRNAFSYYHGDNCKLKPGQTNFRSAWNKGIPVETEVKNRIKTTVKEKFNSEEMKTKFSDSMKKRWNNPEYKSMMHEANFKQRGRKVTRNSLYTYISPSNEKFNIISELISSYPNLSYNNKGKKNLHWKKAEKCGWKRIKK